MKFWQEGHIDYWEPPKRSFWQRLMEWLRHD